MQALQWLRATAPRPPTVDVVLFNDEVDMLRYRVRLHSTIFSHTVVAQSNLTLSSLPKPMHGARAFSPSERALLGITLLDVPLPPASFHPPNLRDERVAFLRERAMRNCVGRWLARSYPRAVVHFSDVDELLEPQSAALHLAVAAAAQNVSACITPRHRLFNYAEVCPCLSEAWAKAAILRSDSALFAKTLRLAGELRMLPTAVCSESPQYVGWHFSFAMDSAQILRKLRSFAHSSRDDVARLLSMREADAERRIDAAAAQCADPLGRAAHCRGVAFDGRLPPVAGWPRHPKAPRALTAASRSRLHARPVNALNALRAHTRLALHGMSTSSHASVFSAARSDCLLYRSF